MSISKSRSTLASPFAGMVLLLCFELHIRQQSDKLSRAWCKSTNDWTWIGMGVVSTVWTSIIFVSAWAWEEDHSNLCREDLRLAECAGRLAFAPWILVGRLPVVASARFFVLCAGARSLARNNYPSLDSSFGPSRSPEHDRRTERKKRGRLA